MSSFSPRTYQIYKYDTINLDHVYNCFTLLEKPIERNVYKVSLAQMLHYMVDFGIGYNSKCETALTTQQQFSLCRYVNRHATQSSKRPATVADLKTKILDIVQALVAATIKYNNQLLRKTNTVFPKYLFTLDKKLNSLKLKQITGRDYVEMSDFENFSYTSFDSSYNMPKYQNGYVPIANVRCVPEHDHEYHKNIIKTISYKWKALLIPRGNTIWSGDHLYNILCDRYHSAHKDPIGVVRPVGIANNANCEVSLSPSWGKPTGVSCFENEEKDPENAVPTTNGKMLSIRYYGRRYRLFKRTD